MKPQSGYYRNIIGDVFPMIRIAFTHTPMYGVSRVSAENVIELLKNSDDISPKHFPNTFLFNANCFRWQNITFLNNKKASL